MKKHFTLLAFILSSVFAYSQNPSLVADVNSQALFPEIIAPMVPANDLLYFKTGDYPNFSLWRTDGTDEGSLLLKNFATVDLNFPPPVTLNNLFLFTANDGVKGEELWKTDGTAVGTVILKDIVPGAVSADISQFMKADQLVFFNVEKPGESELWKTDGTTQGTELVKDSVDATGSFIAFNGKLIFSANQFGLGNELWISDGTSSGTHLLKDISSGNQSSDPTSFTLFNNAVYFTAFQHVKGTCLWKTDGTAIGTVLVKDFDPLSSNALNIDPLTVVNNNLFLTVFTMANGAELWVSDGSAGGTKILEINPGAASSYPLAFTAFNSQLYFDADDGVHGNELWKSDGTLGGTQMVADINPGAADSDPWSDGALKALALVNNELYFGADDGIHGREPWRSDGTSSGTALICDLVAGASGSAPFRFLPAGSRTVFLTSPSLLKYDIWSTDGTAVGTVSLSAAIPEIDDDVANLTVLNNKVYFTTNDELWYTDGTIAGTQQLNYTEPNTDNSYPKQVVKIGADKYVFVADDGIHGDELWVTDGSPSGTSLLKDIFPGSDGSNISLAATEINGKLFFRATSHPNQTGLWITDGTETGTVQISDCDPILSNENNYYQLTYVAVNNVLYFVAGTSQYQQELWRSDGTALGTYQVSFISTGNAEVKDLTLNNGFIYFHARSPVYGRELFKSDGTTAGTTLVKDISPNTDSTPEYLTSYNGKVYFKAYDGLKNKLWVTDGTAPGTKIVKNSGGPVDPAYLQVAGNLLYFSATSPGVGKGLWKTDGTADGTTLLKDIDPDGLESGPTFLTDVNGTLYFIATVGIFEGLWKSNGTDSGTEKITDFKSVVYGLLNVNGDLYFITSDNNDNQVLWRSDGTGCHTQKLDFVPGYSDETSILGADGSTLFLGLFSPQYGIEPWKYETSPITYVEVCNGFDDDCNGVVDDNPVAIINPQGNITECKGIPVTLTTESENNLSYQWLKNGNAIAGATGADYTTTLGGNFSVSVNSTGGCAALSDITHISRVNLPAATITPSGSLDICTTGSVNLNANSGAGYSYQWYRNNNKISGATNQLFTATQKGKYTVEVTNSNGCSKLSMKVTVSSSCKESGLSEDQFTMNVYPNPASTILNISCLNNENENEANGTVLIINSIGQIVFTQPFTSSEIKIDVSSFAEGMYLLQLKTGTNTLTGKFMKE